MKCTLVSLLVASLAAEAFAFAPSSTRSSSTSQLNMNTEKMNGILKPFGTVAIAASLAFNPISASAVQVDESALLSSSIQLSESVKVLDMGLPSYGDISNPKAAQTSIKGAAPEEDKGDSSAGLGLPTKKSGGNSLYASKKPKPEPKKKVLIEKTAEEKEADEKKPLDTVRFTDMSMPSYSDTASGPKKSKFAL